MELIEQSSLFVGGCYYFWLNDHKESTVVNPRRACAGRITVVVLCVHECECVCVCVCVCYHAKCYTPLPAFGGSCAPDLTYTVENKILLHSALISRNLNFADSCLQSFCWINFMVLARYGHLFEGIGIFRWIIFVEAIVLAKTAKIKSHEI